MTAHPRRSSDPSATGFAPRRDVRLITRAEHLYICASTGSLRLRGTFPGHAVNEDGGPELGDLPEPVMTALRQRGLVQPGERRLAHPLYGNGVNGDDDHRASRGAVVMAGQGPLQTAVVTLLKKAGVPVRTSPSALPDTFPDADSTANTDTPGTDTSTGAVLLPLATAESTLRRWTWLSARAGLPLVTYLSTPTRLLLATLTPPRTPCPVCLVRRLRANHIWQPVADLPLDILFGAADSDTWPTTAIAAGVLAHETLTVLSGTARRDPPTLTELDHASLDRVPHRLLHTPNCPACPADTAPLPVPPLDPAGGSRADLERLSAAVDPLTGVVAELRMLENTRTGVAAQAITAGAPTTTWFSPVRAQAHGGAAKRDPELARVCAVGETLERYGAGVYDPQRLVRASLAALGDAALDPRELPLGSAQEYARLPRYAPFDPDQEIDWVQGTSLTTGRSRYVPACAVYLPYRFPPGHKPWYDCISNGLAAGRDVEHATLGGLLELVERDAAILFWANKLVLPSVDLAGFREGPLAEILGKLAAAGFQVSCKDLTTDLGIPATGVRLFDGAAPDRPFVAHAARAAMDLPEAILGALEEACLTSDGLKNWLAEKSIPAVGQRLSELPEFCLYYCAPDRLRDATFWDEGPLRPAPAPRSGPVSTDEDLEEAVRRLADAGHETITVDITPIDVAECGAAVVRTVVPGLCPLTLRSDFHRRGGPRVFDAPVRMGARATALAEDELNPLPLPFP